MKKIEEKLCKLQCVEVHTLLKKSRLDLVIFLYPIKVFVAFHPKYDKVQPWIFFTKYKLQHTVIYTFFCQFQNYLYSFFYLYYLMSSSYILM